KEFQTNRHWQFIDREGYWICPFCGTLQADVKLTSPLSIPDAVIEKAYRHLWSRCSSFKPSSHVLRPLQQLQDTLRKTNDDGKVAFLVGDVSGHGIEAGILMGMAKKVLWIRLQDYQDPVEAIVRANEDIDRDLGRVNFVTAFVAIYDPKRRVLTCVRAGHNPPLLFNPAREGRCVQLKPGGLGLGIMSEAHFAPTIKVLEMP